MAPVLVACYRGVGIVLVVHMIGTCRINEQAIRIVHKTLRRRVVDLWAVMAGVCAWHDSACW